MLKKLLLCTSLLLGASTPQLYAQRIQKMESVQQTVAAADGVEEIIDQGKAIHSVKAPTVQKAHIDLKGNEVWWGYFNGKYRTHKAEDLLKYGFGGAAVYACGIKIPANNAFDMGKGKTIEGIKFIFPDIKNIDDVKIWISTKLSTAEDMSDCDIYVQNVDKADLVDATKDNPDNYINEIRLDQPYTIGDKDIYVGYSFRVTQIDDHDDQVPVVLDNNDDNIICRDGAFLRRYGTSPTWRDGTDYGVLAIQLLMSSANFKDNVLEMEDDFDDVVLEKNGTGKVAMTLSTSGKNGLKDFKYVVSIDGQVSDEQTVALEKPIKEMGGKYTYEFPVKAGDKQGVYPVEIKVVEVNGGDNEGSKTVAKGEMVVVEKPAVRKVFVEDYTGLWSSGYAFGYASKIRLKEKYGDKVALVTVHNGMSDPMTDKEYDEYLKAIGLKYFPNTDIDRTFFQVYPYLGANKSEYFRFEYADTVDEALKLLSLGSVDVSGKVSDDGSKVDLEAKVKFGFTGEKSNYALFYVLTEDGMHDDAWVQDNGMQDYAGIGLEEVEPLFDPFINGPEEMKGLVYDDVVVASKGVHKGIEGSISSTIKLDEVQTNHFSFTLSDYPIIQDKSKLRAFAVLLDTKSGKVVNVNECKVTNCETGISNVTTDGKAVEVTRYTAVGRQVSQPVKGVNIVRYSDSRVVKTVVR